MELHVIGEIEGAHGFGGGGLLCKWSVVYGDGWGVLEGVREGQTQVDRPWSSSDEAVWSHPVDLHLRTSTWAGWPMFRLQVWSHDLMGRTSLCGYGCCRVPTSPGEMHRLDVATWRPRGSVIQECAARLVGGAPVLPDERLISSSAGTERRDLKTVSSGTVTLVLGVILKGHSRHSISV